MNEIISLLQLAIPFLIVLLLPIAGSIWVVVGAQKTLWWVAIYFVCLFYFPNASWGLVDKGSDSSFYNRGTGLFFFSAVNIFLIGLAAQALAARTWANPLRIESNLTKQAIFFWIILMGNVFLGIFLENVQWFEVFGYSGLINVANFMLAFFILTSCLHKSEDLDRLVNILLFCAVTRGLWGAFRFLALGGDPANFYANFQKIDVTLTFFDINDTLVAALALFVAGWRLTSGTLLPRRHRVLYWAIVALELFIIVFSYRRTAWGGLVLAFLVFALCQSRQLKISLLLAFVSLGIPALIYKSFQRAGANLQSASFIERLFPDIASKGDFSFTTGRFAELYAAYLSFKESPVWGLGAWGRYDGSRFSELAWHQGDFGWMHSGMLHISLKSGLIGAAITIWMFVSFLRFIKLKKATMPRAQLGIMMAGLAGVLFMLPNWLVGTPVIEYRTMQLMAFCFALPYMAHAVVAKKAA